MDEKCLRDIQWHMTKSFQKFDLFAMESTVRNTLHLRFVGNFGAIIFLYEKGIEELVS